MHACSPIPKKEEKSVKEEWEEKGVEMK